jgi:cytidylate kinase
MTPIVICFSGAIRSGKSTLSSGVASELGYPRVSFGDQVRAEAARRGLSQTRQVLQDIGESLVQTAPIEFCKSVLNQANWKHDTSIVIDGVRHVLILDSLRTLVAPIECVLIFVDTEVSVRANRLDEEGLRTQTELGVVENHPTEAAAKKDLPDLADLQVDGGRPAEELIASVVSWVRRRASGDRA